MNIVVVGVSYLKIYFECSLECPPHLLRHVVQYLFILMYNKIFSSIWIKRLLNKLPYVSYIECLCKIIWQQLIHNNNIVWGLLTHNLILTFLSMSRRNNSWKSYEKWRICSSGANSPFFINFSKLFDAENANFENFKNFDLLIEHDVTPYK